MFRYCGVTSVACAAALLAACGSDSPTAAPAPSTAHGTLAVSPPVRVASVDAATFQAQLGASPSGAQLLEVAGAPICGVDFYYMLFWTLGALGEITQSSGALMVPTGAAPACSGPRPIVLYGHGTQFEKSFNIADATLFATTNAEGALPPPSPLTATSWWRRTTPATTSRRWDITRSSMPSNSRVK
jgi:hypothetical protein